MNLTKNASLAAVLAISTICSASTPAKAAAITSQGISFASLLKGSGYPLTMKPADLPTDFVAAKITADGGGAGGGFMDMFMSPMMMMMGALGGSSGGPGDEAMAAIGALDLSWSKGEVTNVDGLNFLVTYKGGLDMKDLSGMDKKDTLADTVLRLNLIRVDSIKTLVPRPDMTKEDFVKMMNTKFPKKVAKPAEKVAESGA